MRVSPSISSEDQTLAFLLSAWSQKYWGATSPTTLQCTQPKVDKPKSPLWGAKLLKTKLRCENKQRVVSLKQSGSGRSLGGHLCGVLLPENGRRSFVDDCLEPRSRRREAGRTSSERPPSWVVTETDIGAHAYMSVYESLCLRSPISAVRARPGCTRSRPDRVWSLQIRPDIDHRPYTLGPGEVPLSWS